MTIFFCGLVRQQKWAATVYLGVRRVHGRPSRARASVASLAIFAGAGCGEGPIICDGAPVLLALEGPAPVWFAFISAASQAFASQERSSGRMSCPLSAPLVCSGMVSLARCDAL